MAKLRVIYKNKKEVNHMEKRIDYLSWDEFFMGIANIKEIKIKKPTTQVGACIEDEDKKQIGKGYKS